MLQYCHIWKKCVGDIDISCTPQVKADVELYKLSELSSSPIILSCEKEGARPTVTEGGEMTSSGGK